jgi:hypothetical protein
MWLKKKMCSVLFKPLSGLCDTLMIKSDGYKRRVYEKINAITQKLRFVKKNMESAIK